MLEQNVKKLHANFSLASKNPLNKIFWRIDNHGTYSPEAQSYARAAVRKLHCNLQKIKNGKPPIKVVFCFW
ncbi:hypothetical protein CUR83_08590 [Psychrobacter pocilloporae]|uniref:Uncharacterized protein n=1 Tax=Psychrobacter pocilloporae TaxID=1775882 RepID=A0ABT6ITN0_9GAMM|nr:hypothetical protein [Psychrobacter pocilloporae]